MTGPRQGVLLLANVRPDPGNIRRDLGDLAELTASIRAQGLLQPLLVRRDGDKFILVDGHRRYAAAIEAGLIDVPCIVYERRNGVTAAMLAADMHKSLTPMEQARAFRQMREAGMGTMQIAAATGYSAGTIRERLTLLDLPPDAQAMVADGTVTLGQAASLARQVKARGKGHGRAAARVRDQHFTLNHPQAETARGICVHDGDRAMVGNIACGPCWEAAIRADATGAHLAPVIDEQAVQRAVTGDPVRLTVAELDEAVRRLLATGLSASAAAARLGVTARTVERSKARIRRAAA